MVQIFRSPTVVVLALLSVSSSSVDALKVTFKNACTFPIELYSREGGDRKADPKVSIAVGASSVSEFGKDFEGHFRHGADDAATLIEFSTKGSMNFVWYDISVIPSRLNKGFEFCSSLDECKANSASKKGFNVPVQMTPLANTNGNQCRELTCLQDGCPDAYLFPKDDTKTHACDLNTDFTVTFCPSGSSNGGGNPSPGPAPTSGPPTSTTPSPTTKAPGTPGPTTKAPTTPTPTTKAPATPTPTTKAPTTPVPTTKAPPSPSPSPTMAPAPTAGQTPAPTPTPTTPAPTTPAPTTPTPTPTPGPTPAPTPAPTPESTPSPTPEPSVNGKIHGPFVDKLVIATNAPVFIEKLVVATKAPASTPAPGLASTPTPAPASAPASPPAPTPAPASAPTPAPASAATPAPASTTVPAVPGPMPSPSSKPKKNIKHCV